MARSSHGSRRTAAWAVAHKPKPMPRVVRLGRPANDNARGTSLPARVLLMSLAAGLVAFALYDWRLI